MSQPFRTLFHVQESTGFGPTSRKLMLMQYFDSSAWPKECGYVRICSDHDLKTRVQSRDKDKGRR